MTPDSWVLVPIAGMATGALFMLGIYKLVVRWLEYRYRRPSPAGGEEIGELQRQVADLGTLAPRVAELEERLDFAERLLARGRERGAIPRAGPD